MAVECAARSSVIAPDKKVFRISKRQRRMQSYRRTLGRSCQLLERTLKSGFRRRFWIKKKLLTSQASNLLLLGALVLIRIVLFQRLFQIRKKSKILKFAQTSKRALSRTAGLKAGQKLKGLPITHAFIGSLHKFN